MNIMIQMDIVTGGNTIWENANLKLSKALIYRGLLEIKELTTPVNYSVVI